MIVCVTGGKGGPGATVLAVRLAAGLARRGRRVLLTDLDPAGGDVGAYLDPAALDPRRGLLPLLKLARGPIAPAALATELQPVVSGLHVLLGMLRPAPDLVLGRAHEVLEAARELAEVVVADLGRAAPGSPVADAVASADRVVLAARADVQGALAAERALQAIGESRRVTIAATRIRRLSGADVVELPDALGRDISIALPDCKPGKKSGRRLQRSVDALFDRLAIDPTQELMPAAVAEAVAS